MKNEREKSRKSLNFFSVYPVTSIAAALCAVMCAVMLFYNKIVALAGFAVLLLIIAFAFCIKEVEFRRLQGNVKFLEKKLSADEEGALLNFPLPILLFDSSDRMVWYNNLFRKNFLSEKSVHGLDVKQFTSGKGLSEIRNGTCFECEYGGNYYTVFNSTTVYKKETFYALYFVEDTVLKQYRAKYIKSRPVIMLISLDTVEEYLRDFRESQQAEIMGGVETIIENWFAGYNCIVKKLGSGKFIVFAEKSEVDKMKTDKFSVLSVVRSYAYGEKTLGLTLSVGVGMGLDIPDCEATARQALDMALGRGGDQVAVKDEKGEYEFFGGVSKGVERRTKVRTRIVASAIGEIIRSSSNVLIMGHRFSDLDALGSAAGVAMICEALEKEAKIVVSSKTTLAMPLVKHLHSNGLGDLLIEPHDCENYLNDGTLLIITDTHRKSFLEYPELFDKVGKAVVIDHHRKTVDHISKAVIFYHEPNASSASEMVTELIEYMNMNIKIPQACAEALLSGITLDTKNFVMNTGVLTFEAAAFLRSMGADTVAVKQLFSNSMKTQKAKSEVVKNAAVYKNCAVGVVDFESDDVRIVASQAADELLNVSKVAASFVLFKTDSTINISARSYGELNVQLVMEELGGGGHQTMAAAQLDGVTFEQALKELSAAIDKVNETSVK